MCLAAEGGAFVDVPCPFRAARTDAAFVRARLERVRVAALRLSRVRTRRRT